MTIAFASSDARQQSLRRSIWIAVIVASSLAFSSAFACATPFVALATVAGTRMRRGDALTAVLLAWLGNQAIGFLVLGYPRTADAFAWGAAIGIAACAATLVVVSTTHVSRHAYIVVAVAFAAAFVVYEGTLLATTLVLGSGASAFTPAIIGRILSINAIACAGLFGLHQAAVMTRLVRPGALPREPVVHV